jgi:hypothetical protein
MSEEQIEVTASLWKRQHATLELLARKSGTTIEQEIRGAITRGLLAEKRLSDAEWEVLTDQEPR